MNWGELLTEVRIQIEDNGATRKYADELLYTYLREALADYSQYLPLSYDGVVLSAVEGNPKKFVLPSDFIREIAVRCPEDRFLEPRRGRLGTNVARSNRVLFYRKDSKWLYLEVEPGANSVYLDYYASHPLPATADDLPFELTIPDNDVELIKLFIEAKINTKIRNAQARLDRFKLGNAERTDNPMTYEVIDFFTQYREKLSVRLPNDPAILYRPRRWK